MFEMAAGGKDAAGGQTGVDLLSDRRDMLQEIAVPCRVIAFADDLICPPHLYVEVADAIPDRDFVEIGSRRHLGYLERPQAANSAIIEFLGKN